MIKKILLSSFLCINSRILAQNIGNIAQQGYQTTHIATMMTQKICIIVGVALLLASVIKLHTRRKNPDACPLSLILLLTFMGFSLIALGFAPMPK